MPFLEEEERECESGAGPRSEGVLLKLMKSRTVLVTGPVDQEMAERVMTQLLVLDAESHDPIRVIVSSPGGHVDSGFAIYDMMRFVSSPVMAIGAGWVASIAVPILFGGDSDKRFALPNTRFLIHQPSGGAGGQASDIRIEAQEILKIRQRINHMISQETGQPVDKVAKDSDRNFWMSAEEALEYGLITRIVAKAGDII